jgi:hypothetical protein
MSLLRYTRILIAALLLTAAGAAGATDVSMAGGSVQFSTPDSWVGIMQVDGDPEVRVFQVPDPSPSASNTLARVTVTVKQIGDLGSFQSYVEAAIAKAKGMTGYQPSERVPADPNSFAYSARESGTPYDYVERYWFKNGHAIQLRCARPAQSEAGAAWQVTFDKGCAAVAAALQ